MACESQGHRIHRHCLDAMSSNLYLDVLSDPSKPSALFCSHPRCNARYTEQQLLQGACSEVQSLFQRVADADSALAAMSEAEQIRHTQKASFMCPKCSYGPIIHSYCPDLRRHNGQSGIKNCCPQCHFFAPDIRGWARWDGQLPSGFAGGCAAAES